MNRGIPGLSGCLWRVLFFTLASLLLLPVLVDACIASPNHISTKPIPPHSTCILDYAKIPVRTLEESLVGSYGEHLRPLGAGASGNVSLFRRFEDGQQVAIKHFPPIDLVRSHGQGGLRDQQVKLEFHIGTLLRGCPGIAETLELLFEEPSGRLHLVTAYYSRSLARERRHIDKADILDLFHQMLIAARCIHDRGIVYGDAKIENVLIDVDDTLKLIDFGSATFARCPVDTPESEANVVPGDYGTPAYMPPEVFYALEYDRKKADVWAFGILLHVMIQGYMPWSVASVVDRSFRRFMGWESECSIEGSFRDLRCLQPSTKLEDATCSLHMMELLYRIPLDVRGVVSQMLDPNPLTRPSFEALLLQWPSQSPFPTQD